MLGQPRHRAEEPLAGCSLVGLRHGRRLSRLRTDQYLAAGGYVTGSGSTAMILATDRLWISLGIDTNAPERADHLLHRCRNLRTSRAISHCDLGVKMVSLHVRLQVHWQGLKRPDRHKRSRGTGYRARRGRPTIRMCDQVWSKRRAIP